ncbi:MAG: hypothetical protein HC804_12690 [Anaerolineae bacterium]|nr:hypothetical protein [Anaerolineae bacterium]
MSVVLWPIVSPIVATITGTLFALATSTSFLRDWLVVIGWIDPATAVLSTMAAAGVWGDGRGPAPTFSPCLVLLSLSAL